ncbi:hypothetical protein THASP1DRAFT_22631 [Thamnocephalis sphaerospora]|uniref:Uncharacterized protein n=1 Tax=Thamnocephalis sphaerospora TaxID=78915 RepID=A0A4V1IX21_9FUNG|nr:hypothetical protein THASP1DRAFT_22631 [Thamnocephalis sphaerospora]|eukprot:RKP09539.1 hypothetical protein THASP1DRAFT_22631 [Thamnocephalis sphaerospora]
MPRAMTSPYPLVGPLGDAYCVVVAATTAAAADTTADSAGLRAEAHPPLASPVSPLAMGSANEGASTGKRMSATMVSLTSQLDQCTVANHADAPVGEHGTVAQPTTVAPLLGTRRPRSSMPASTAGNATAPVASARRRHHPYATMPRLSISCAAPTATMHLMADPLSVSATPTASDYAEPLRTPVASLASALPAIGSPKLTTILSSPTLTSPLATPTAASRSVVPPRCRRGRRNAIGDVALELALIQRACSLFGY